MKKNISVVVVIAVFCLFVGAGAASAQQTASPLEGKWKVKYADGSEGGMTVDKKSFTLTVPAVGELKGMIQNSGTYFESILDRRTGINFIFGYIKGATLEGKLQEQKPCAELKKAFKSGVVESSSTCQAAFTAVK